MLGFLKERGILSFTRLITAISIVSFLIVSFYLAYTNTDWRGYDTFSNLTGGGGIGAQLVNKFINSKYNTPLGTGGKPMEGGDA